MKSKILSLSLALIAATTVSATNTFAGAPSYYHATVITSKARASGAPHAIRVHISCVRGVCRAVSRTKLY